MTRRVGPGVPARNIGVSDRANRGTPARTTAPVGGLGGRSAARVDVGASARFNPSHNIGTRQVPGADIAITTRIGHSADPVLSAQVRGSSVVLTAQPPVVVGGRNTVIARPATHVRTVRHESKGFCAWLCGLLAIIFCCKRPSR